MLVLELKETDEKILNKIWGIRNPVTAREIAELMGLDYQSACTYLHNLEKSGFVASRGHGYVLTRDGKEMLDISRIDEQVAREILAKVAENAAFPFYAGPDEPLGVYADSLTDLCSKIKSVDIKSIEFHMARRDFETWTYYLCDVELKKRLKSLREAELSGEELREVLYDMIHSRCQELTRAAS